MTYKERIKEFHRLKGIEVRKNSKELKLDGIQHTSKKDYAYIEKYWAESQCRIMWIALSHNIKNRNGVTCIFCLYSEMTNSNCTLCMWANNHGGPCGWVFSEYRNNRNNPVDLITWETYEKMIRKLERIK